MHSDMPAAVELELPIPVPALSDLDVEGYIHATESAFKLYDQHEQYSHFTMGMVYPWVRRILFRDQRFDGPAITHLKPLLLPVMRLNFTRKDINSIYQKVWPGYDFEWHLDGGDDPYGLRLGWGLRTDVPFLEFRRMKVPRGEFSKNDYTKREALLEPESHFFTPSSPTCFFAMNGHHYAHRVVPHDPLQPRFVLVMCGNGRTLQMFKRKPNGS